MRILGDHPLDETRIDEVAIAADATAAAVVEIEPAFRVPVAHVAAAVPAALDLAPGGAGVAEVFDGGLAALGPAADLADHAGGAFLAVLVQHLHQDALDGLADGPHRADARGLEGHAAAVAGAVDLEDADAEALLESFPDFRTQAVAMPPSTEKLVQP